MKTPIGYVDYIGRTISIEDSVGGLHYYKVTGLKPKFDEQKGEPSVQLLVEPILDINDPLWEPTCSFWEWADKCTITK
jgi:hypothetical protein